MSKLWLQNTARTFFLGLLYFCGCWSLSMPLACGMIYRKRKAAWVPVSVLLTLFPLTIFERRWFPLLHSLKSQSDQFPYFSTSCSEYLWHCLANTELNLLPEWAISCSGQRGSASRATTKQKPCWESHQFFTANLKSMPRPLWNIKA